MERLLNVAEAAEILGVKPNTIEVWICENRYPLKYIKIGRLLKFRESDLQDFINKNTRVAEVGK